MKDLESAVNAIASELGLRAPEIEERRAFLEIDEADIRLLREIQPHLRMQCGDFAGEFYRHLMAFPGVRAMLPDASTLEHLMQVQARYFDELTNGRHDADYVKSRLRVGLAHERMGVEPKWYFGAYRKYFSGFAPRLWRLLGSDPDKFLRAQDALLKVIFFDIGLALDTYFQAQRQKVVQLKDYSERIVDRMPCGLMVLDGTCHVRSVNRTMADMLGIRDETEVVGRPVRMVAQDAALIGAIGSVLATGADMRDLILSREAGAATRELAFTISCVQGEGESLLLVLAQEITTQQRLRKEQQLFRLALDSSNDAVYLIDRSDMRFVDINARASRATGYSRAELLRMGPSDLIVGFDADGLAESCEASMAAGSKAVLFEATQRSKDGVQVPIEVYLNIFRSDGKPMLIAVARDISERKRTEQVLLRLVHYDSLTGLPNRTLLQDRLSQAIAHANRSDKLVSVMLIDLDRFKNINDSLGHAQGDKVLVEVGRRFNAAVRAADTVARLGGDEFVVLIGDGAWVEDVAQLARRLLDAVSLPFELDGHEVFLSASIGISMYPKDGMDGQALLKNADTAMYRAKSIGRNAYQFYTAKMNDCMLERLTLESRLQHALEREEFVVHYQPQADMATGRIAGVEALLRWMPAGQTVVPPSDFIPILEECGLIMPVGEWVLRQACARARAWQDAGHPFVRTAVNLSARQFRHPGLEQTIARILQETSCEARCLEIEITESVVMEDPDEASRVMHALSDMGIRLSIDDFGTGYSSLAYLKRFPIHSLKIDRSFVRDLATDSDDAAIAQAIIVLAHSMGLGVTAEGVETLEQFEVLRGMQCDMLQGYLFSYPMAADALETFFAAQQDAIPPWMRGRDRGNVTATEGAADMQEGGGDAATDIFPAEGID